MFFLNPEFTIGFITVLFVYFVFVANTPDKEISSAPNILTSVGIFFTFLGVSVSLYHFDADNITSSIPDLLDGLKIAFFSSVAGLGYSILYRAAKYYLNSINKKQGVSSEVGPEDFLREMRGIKDALIGEGDASLSTQIGKLRNDFRDFADKVAEDGSKKLIEALENVIQDFNQKITEQFGDNFKQLNEAVGALLEWQKEYKEQVEILTKAFKDAQEGIEKTSQSLEKIEQSTASIPEQMKGMQEIYEKTNERLEELTAGLASMAELRDKAENSLPDINKHIDSLIETMRLAVDEQLSNMNDFQTTQKDFSEDLANSLREAAQQTETLINQSIQEVNEKMGEQIGGALEMMGNQLTAISKALHSSYEQHYQEISKALKK